MMRDTCRLSQAVAIAVALVATIPDATAAEPEPEPETAPTKATKQSFDARVNRHAAQLEPSFMAGLRAELELAHKTCGTLPAEARRKVVATGNEAVKTAVRQWAVWQLTGQQSAAIDPRVSIHEAVAREIKPHVAAEEFAAYEREWTALTARRNRAARMAIVMKLERSLGLSMTQCAAIEADLEKLWQADWQRELADQGNYLINGRRPAPDFADKAIAPHLDERQRAEWQTWRQQASSPQRGFGWNMSNQSLEPDPWWEQ